MTGLQKIDSVLDLLLRARERLGDPAMWTNCAMGKFGQARCVGYTLLEIDDYSKTSDAAIRALERHVGIGRVVDWNDTHTHAEVLALLDKAISDRVC